MSDSWQIDVRSGEEDDGEDENTTTTTLGMIMIGVRDIPEHCGRVSINTHLMG